MALDPYSARILKHDDWRELATESTAPIHTQRKITPYSQGVAVSPLAAQALRALHVPTVPRLRSLQQAITLTDLGVTSPHWEKDLSALGELSLLMRVSRLNLSSEHFSHRSSFTQRLHQAIEGEGVSWNAAWTAALANRPLVPDGHMCKQWRTELTLEKAWETWTFALPDRLPAPDRATQWNLLATHLPHETLPQVVKMLNRPQFLNGVLTRGSPSWLHRTVLQWLEDFPASGLQSKPGSSTEHAFAPLVRHLDHTACPLALTDVTRFLDRLGDRSAWPELCAHERMHQLHETPPPSASVTPTRRRVRG